MKKKNFQKPAKSNDALPLRGRELFIDDFLTEKRDGLTLAIHQPQPQPPEPTQPTGGYMSMLQVDGKIIAYSRRSFFEFTGANSPFTVKPGYVNDYTAYAESTGGIKFLEPPLYKYDCGVPNVMLCLDAFCHNFSPFYDENPACPADEKYKAVAGVSDTGGLYGFVASLPYMFRKLDKPLIKPKKAWGYCFDSQNVAFWSEAEGCYVCYFRRNDTADGKVLRSFCKATSPDFRHWGNLEMQRINEPNEHLYVNQMAPYPRAKHIYIGTPTRYCEERGSATDIVLVFSRGGQQVFRPTKEAWIRPGLDPKRWQNRANYLAHNVVQTSPSELSLYHCHSKVRYTLRTDGFMSLHAGYGTGEWLSKVLRYDGGALELNVSTGVMGALQVEVQHPDGTPVPGFALDDSELFFGDAIAYRPTWRGATALPLKPGDAFRLRLVARECDVYSLAFI